MAEYSETLLDHFHSPRNRGELPGANAAGTANLHGRAPYVTLALQIVGDTVQQIRFEAFGCGVTVASASALTEMVAGRSLADCLHITPAQIIGALDGVPVGKEFCADLAVGALRQAIERFRAPRPAE